MYGSRSAVRPDDGSCRTGALRICLAGLPGNRRFQMAKSLTELRADFQHLRRWRKSVEQAQSYTLQGRHYHYRYWLCRSGVARRQGHARQMIRVIVTAASPVASFPAHAIPCWMLKKAVAQYGEAAVEILGAIERHLGQGKSRRRGNASSDPC